MGDNLDPLDEETAASATGDDGTQDGSRDATEGERDQPTDIAAGAAPETDLPSDGAPDEALAFRHDDEVLSGTDAVGSEVNSEQTEGNTHDESETTEEREAEFTDGEPSSEQEAPTDEPRGEAPDDGAENQAPNDDAENQETEQGSEGEPNPDDPNEGSPGSKDTDGTDNTLRPGQPQAAEPLSAPISGYTESPYECIWTEVQDAVECGVRTVSDAAICGYTLTRDATLCGTEIVRDAAICGTQVVADATRCGTTTVTSVAQCGTRTVTSAAQCGVDVIASGLDCVARLAQGKSCESPKTCKVAATCNVANTCEVAAECSVAKECDIAATCEIANTCDVQICKQTAPGGQCTPLLAECDIEGFSCQVSADAEVFRCLPNYDKDLAVEDEAVCRALFVDGMSDMAREAGNTLAFSAGSSASVGVRGSLEVGTVYGEGGEYGCFVATCEGFETDIQISDFANLGAYINWEAFAGESQTFTFGASIPEIEIGVSTTSVLDAQFETYIGQVDSVSLGLGVAPAQASYAACTTTVFQVENP